MKTSQKNVQTNIKKNNKEMNNIITINNGNRYNRNFQQ